jgi:hypothetical protein
MNSVKYLLFFSPLYQTRRPGLSFFKYVLYRRDFCPSAWLSNTKYRAETASNKGGGGVPFFRTLIFAPEKRDLGKPDFV